MDAIAVANTAITAMNGGATNKKLEGKMEAPKKNRIQVSNTKKPLFFYLNLAKRLIKQHNDIVLSALGMAIPTVVTIAEILKTNGLAMEKQVLTSTVSTKDVDSKGRVIQKPKIEIVLAKNENAENQKATGRPAPKETDAGNPKIESVLRKNENAENKIATAEPAPEKVQPKRESVLAKNENCDELKATAGPSPEEADVEKPKSGIVEGKNESVENPKPTPGTAPEKADADKE